jgi:hypothetical protein
MPSLGIWSGWMSCRSSSLQLRRSKAQRKSVGVSFVNSDLLGIPINVHLRFQFTIRRPAKQFKRLKAVRVSNPNCKSLNFKST